MKLYLAIPLVLAALLIAASGTAAVSRGWVLPLNRRHVRSPHVYGWGQLVVAFALCWQLVFALAISDSGTRPTGTLIGAVILLVGIAVMMVGQLVGEVPERTGTRHRSRPGTHGRPVAASAAAGQEVADAAGRPPRAPLPPGS
ncbi:hypothetical protein SAMN05216532_0010 [Streptomyces sp. 2231.1]|uniref:hypothetical protein n=1 Tax=Streptomyces sp. 2231.1 TaxID=1855347 RepID=UPI00089D8BE0|nr:hypothetical protein [Streptomyces sp. 2231.1]SEB95437.1 hypothetical protein SAMN05216532_0010 [Streptomyces sp. 2231.1]